MGLGSVVKYYQVESNRHLISDGVSALIEFPSRPSTLLKGKIFLHLAILGNMRQGKPCLTCACGAFRGHRHGRCEPKKFTRFGQRIYSDLCVMPRSTFFGFTEMYIYSMMRRGKLVCPRDFDVARRKAQTATPLRLLRLAVYCTVIGNTDTFAYLAYQLLLSVHPSSPLSSLRPSAPLRPSR